ncbi:MAG: glycosyltransferase, partial [Phormidesmis sp.]
MKKLLLVTTIPDTLEGFFLPFAHHMRSQGWQVDGMACEISDCAACVDAFDHTWNVSWSRNPLEPRNLVSAPRTVRAVVQQENYDIVHVFTPVAAFVTRYALRNFRVRPRVLYTALGFHFYKGGRPFKNAVFLTLEKLAGFWTDYLVIVNEEDKAAAHQHNLVSPERIRHIPSGIGIDLTRFSGQQVSSDDVFAIRSELGLDDHQPLFLSVAEFIPRKHPQDVIQAIAHLPRSNVHLAFAGEGDLLLEMKALAAQLGVSDRVHFLGHRRDIPALMQTAVAVILASEQEGLPISVIEALCMKKPVIGTNIRGTQDLLQNGCGLLVPLENPEALAQAMAHILDHPDDAQMMAERGQKQMKQYDVKNVLRQQERLYNEIVQSSAVKVLSTPTAANDAVTSLKS